MRIKHLDGLRCVAIILVLLFHSYSHWHSILPYQTLTKDFVLFKFGFYGVELFFMISGFVIFMTLDKSKNFPIFLKRRWLRLFPAMFITSIISYLTSFYLVHRPYGNPTLLSLLPGFLFIHPQFLHFITGINIQPLEGVYWSLYIEVFFYLFIGFVYFFIGRKHCIKSLTMLYILALFIGFLSKVNGYSGLLTISNVLGLKYFGYFTIGCVMYEAINNKLSNENLALASLCAALCILRPVHGGVEGAIEYLIAALVILIFVFSFYSPYIKRILSFKYFTIIGTISYSLYLLHESILISLMRSISSQRISLFILQVSPIIILLVIIVFSYFIEKKIEPKLRDKLTSILFPAERKKLTSSTESRIESLNQN